MQTSESEQSSSVAQLAPRQWPAQVQVAGGAEPLLPESVPHTPLLQTNGSLGLAWGVAIEVVKSRIQDLPAEIDVALAAGIRVQCAESREAEIQSGSSVRVPRTSSRSSAASLTTITNKEWSARCYSINANNNLSATVLGQVAGNQTVVHGNQVVAVNFVQVQGDKLAAFDIACVRD